MYGNADRCITETLKLEGGFVNDPDDDGGPTNKGITLTTFRRYNKPTATLDDLKHMSTEIAIDIYKQRYWNRVRADELPSGVDNAVYDFAVHSGPHRAVTCLQHVLKTNGMYDGEVDGVIGPKTLNGCRSFGPRDLISILCTVRKRYLATLDDWSKYGKGWTNRVYNTEVFSLSLVSSAIATKQGIRSKLCKLFHRS